MYSWKTLRILSAILLCVPLLHVSLIASRDLRDYLDPSPDVWDDELAAIIEQDQGTELPEHPILVAGGQRVRLWRDLPAALRPRATLLRPLGDATLEDITHHYERLVAYYRPEVLIVLPSYADLHLRDAKTPEEFAAALKDLLAVDASYAGTTRRYLLAPVKTLLHPEDDARIEAMVAASRAVAAAYPATTVIDPNPILADIQGSPDPDLYRSDGINLNSDGYARLSALLRATLQDDGFCSSLPG
jgi:lysophospholipase L1-like esterase